MKRNRFQKHKWNIQLLYKQGFTFLFSEFNLFQNRDPKWSSKQTNIKQLVLETKLLFDLFLEYIVIYHCNSSLQSNSNLKSTECNSWNWFLKRYYSRKGLKLQLQVNEWNFNIEIPYHKIPAKSLRFWDQCFRVIRPIEQYT